MASLLAGDLRRAGTDAKREHDHKAKWAYGARPRNKLNAESPAVIPQLPHSHGR